MNMANVPVVEVLLMTNATKCLLKVLERVFENEKGVLELGQVLMEHQSQQCSISYSTTSRRQKVSVDRATS